MCGIALSQLGLKPVDFYDLTPVEFFYAVEDRKATIMNIAKLDDSRFQMLAGVVRMGAWYTTNVQLPKKYRIGKPERMMKFPWDRGGKYQAQTPEEMRKLMKMMAETFKRRREERETRRAGQKRRTKKK